MAFKSARMRFYRVHAITWVVTGRPPFYSTSEQAFRKKVRSKNFLHTPESDDRVTLVITLKIFSLLHPLVQSRTWTLRRTAPSQTEVTGLNCSYHSTTSKEMVSWRALVRIHLTRIQDPTIRYISPAWFASFDYYYYYYYSLQEKASNAGILFINVCT